MNKIFATMKNGVANFARDEEGAQIVEYALVIAVISVAVLAALKATVTGGLFTGWFTRVTTCLTGGACA
jgi:pilus assembly protein Flp/PilA